MEAAQGGNLCTHVRESRGGLSEPEARRVFRQLLESVAYLHTQGIVHRDVKVRHAGMRRG